MNNEIARNQKRTQLRNDTQAVQDNDDDLSEVKNDLNIPQKLRDIIDDTEDDYKVFFKTDSELMDIFENLEEKNLFLIQQGQENEQQIEMKRLEQKETQRKLESEIQTLEDREREVQQRTEKTMREKANLEDQTSDVNNKVISDRTFKIISDQAAAILGTLD